jgi:hypothetical protein
VAESWTEFEVLQRNFGDQIVLLEDGTVVLGAVAVSDGTLIDKMRFGGQFTAQRLRGFGQTLQINTDNGESFFFRYDGVKWLRRVPIRDGAPTISYKAHKKFGQHGAFLGMLNLLTNYSFAFLLIAFFILESVGLFDAMRTRDITLLATVSRLMWPLIGGLAILGILSLLLSAIQDLMERRRAKQSR